MRRGLRRASAPPEQLVNGTSGPSVQAELAVSEEEPLLVDRARPAPVGKLQLDERDVAAQMPRHLQRHARQAEAGQMGAHRKQGEAEGGRWSVDHVALVRNAPRR